MGRPKMPVRRRCSTPSLWVTKSGEHSFWRLLLELFNYLVDTLNVKSPKPCHIHIFREKPMTTASRIRAFNRFYTRKIGLITNRFLKSDFSLFQARFLFEINRNAPLYAAAFTRKFDISADYLSKIISKFEAQGLITRSPSPRDSRKQILAPTPAGRAAYENLKERSNGQIEKLLHGLPPEEIQKLIGAMGTIEKILEGETSGSNLVTLRSHRPGDIGMVIHRHGVLYAREHGFNTEFDAYVALGMAKFIETITPREHLWIAETQGRFAGSVAVVRNDDATAQLRWLIVEPGERKKGIGKQLVNEVIRFSREHQYRDIILWTIDFLHPARRLYDQAGFRLQEVKSNHVWGRSLTEECWKLTL
jgi:DNA-binding MarR family transcriptional regulator/GNAT superfamily N-acetyltransferase